MDNNNEIKLTALQKAKELGVEVPKELDGLTKMIDEYESFFNKIII